MHVVVEEKMWNGKILSVRTRDWEFKLPTASVAILQARSVRFCWLLAHKIFDEITSVQKTDLIIKQLLITVYKKLDVMNPRSSFTHSNLGASFQGTCVL